MPARQRSKVPPVAEGEPELQTSRSQMDQELEVQIAQGQELLEQTKAAGSQAATAPRWPPSEGSYPGLRDKYYSWNDYNEQLLRSRFTTGKLADEYRGMLIPFGGGDTEREKLADLADDFNHKIRKLESIRQRLGLFGSVEISATRGDSATPGIGNKVFIVHGHDGDIKQQVATFIEKITGDRPIVLHEKADSGRTVIEKFEGHASEVGFAIILLTADDEGRVKGATPLNSRARQNVVFEFGYFMAKLGRDRVVALHEAGVELPSDISGLLYKSLAGNWKFDLAKELMAAGIEIDVAKALH